VQLVCQRCCSLQAESHIVDVLHGAPLPNKPYSRIPPARVLQHPQRLAWRAVPIAHKPDQSSASVAARAHVSKAS
jgi:hypothetical protein